jgi:predicted PurR-regulated permease PerM
MPRTMPLKSPNPVGASLGGSAVRPLLIAVLLVGALYFGHDVLVPIALSVLMSFVLAPFVRLLQRLYFPRFAAVSLVVALAFSAVFALGGLMASQVNQLARDLPRYQSTLSEKIQTLTGTAAGTGTLERAFDVLKSLKKELEKPKTDSAAPGDSTIPIQPIPVELHQPDPGALQTLAALITPLIHLLATIGLAVVFVIFILLQQQEPRNRLIRWPDRICNERLLPWTTPPDGSAACS